MYTSRMLYLSSAQFTALRTNPFHKMNGIRYSSGQILRKSFFLLFYVYNSARFRYNSGQNLAPKVGFLGSTYRILWLS